MTGRWAIRSGTHSVPFGGVADGLTQWEVTIGEALSDAGYATGYYGKWHLGSHDGRLAVGNTDSDFEMLEWTTSDNGPRFGLIVHHTGADRQCAYDCESLGRLDEGPNRGWTIRRTPTVSVVVVVTI